MAVSIQTDYNTVVGLVQPGRRASGTDENARTKMRYGIVVNPVSGTMSVDRKRRRLQSVADVLGPDCVVAGWETTSREQFAECARELANDVDVLVVAGGDGTFSDVVNSVEPETVLAFLPLGSGCALAYGLDLPGGAVKVARRIRDAQVRYNDLILCNGRVKAFMASVGFEGAIIRRREDLQKDGIKGPSAYALALLNWLLHDFERVDATVTVDGRTLEVPHSVTMVVTKIPYYGYKMKVVPRARFDDGNLHVLAINAGRLHIIGGVAASFLNKNKLGTYTTGRQVKITTDQPRRLQADGNIIGEGTEFEFSILPGALKVKC